MYLHEKDAAVGATAARLDRTQRLGYRAPSGPAAARGGCRSLVMATWPAVWLAQLRYAFHPTAAKEAQATRYLGGMTPKVTRWTQPK